MIFFAHFGILAIILLTGYICLPFLPAFVWALVIHQAGLPLERRLLQHFSPLRTSLLMLLIVLLTIIVPLSLLGGQLVVEASSAYQKLETQGFTTPTAESLRQLILNLPLPPPFKIT
jgi:predicted PurR-regulated permease PerM